MKEKSSIVPIDVTKIKKKMFELKEKYEELEKILLELPDKVQEVETKTPA